MKVLVIPGSNRKKSFNKMLAKEIARNVTDGIEIVVFEIDNIPFFNQDIESDLPSIVNEYIEKVDSADAIIFVTPEYNNMIPGILKNAIEWLSRGYSNHSVRNKPVAITGATDGGFGTVRAQNQLLELCAIIKMKTHSQLRLPVSHADKIFDENGDLNDSEIELKIGKLLKDLKTFYESGEL
ncbi:MAG: NAD(P)H-dependent oxidoreductase [Candidatus Dojkabacteria bacterium]|nr:NAD(P)H-dependent oxidoreductase [Candidatus Dojkabacteria bacterium]MDQ7020581.1 NAD(P)H-dependent oxidoreductase [Candidatus Dojkabacteria bacterium]